MFTVEHTSHNWHRFLQLAVPGVLAATCIGGVVEHQIATVQKQTEAKIQVQAIQVLKPQIRQKLVAIQTPDETDLSPVTVKLKKVDDTLCNNDSVEALGTPCLSDDVGDGLKETRYKLGHNIATIVKETSADEDLAVLNERRKVILDTYQAISQVAGAPQIMASAAQPSH